MAIGGAKCLGYTNGRVKESSKEDPWYEEWESENMLVMNWILNSMEVVIAKSFRYYKNAHELWKAIEIAYSRKKNHYQNSKPGEKTSSFSNLSPLACLTSCFPNEDLITYSSSSPSKLPIATLCLVISVGLPLLLCLDSFRPTHFDYISRSLHFCQVGSDQMADPISVTFPEACISVRWVAVSWRLPTGVRKVAKFRWLQFQNAVNLPDQPPVGVGADALEKERPEEAFEPPQLESGSLTTSSRLNYNLHINCGGEGVEDINGSINYEEDLHPGEDLQPDVASRFFLSKNSNWGSSSTGIFMDVNKMSYIITTDNISRLSMPNPKLYATARLAPSSLSYYGFCLGNGNYNVNLHFAEILFTDDKTYASLGKRVFDVYVQEKLVLKDFNIEKEANGSGKAVVRHFIANVTGNTLEIRFYWAGKGTEFLPNRGTYGPLISAISVEPDFTPPKDSRKISAGVVIGIVASIFCVIFLILESFGGKAAWVKRAQYLRRPDLKTGSFTLRQIKAATNNFDVANKIGEGGFGPVYKGLLYDGTIIAVKQLSSKSKQGNREFVNEIGMISALQHPNLVKLYGCCIEGNQLLLVYEYMENNSLARALFGLKEQQLKLDWPTRHRICVGIARGLAYLHEESRLKIVHRDIKAANVLLDKDLNPKISDFGLAKLDEEENTHISTRIAGTIGYMAPEYAMHGYLTDKADVFSFGIVVLEIVSGKSNTNYKPKPDGIYLMDWAYVLQERGSLIELVDPKLGSEFNKEEAIGMMTIALLCTNSSSILRPTMSAVVSMLEGRTDVQNHISKPNPSSDDLDIEAIGSHHQQIHS
ncbi:Protein kinase domain-containing protein [Cinnamomum micranthum f. kanehirae]|uniref:non-specific serine/threonine protein kinase n=1 Tax=Cinnamomum micranthum f. kanehirae TaxID=337451 RepID=A0A3S3NJA1_9MAGN|nr:Protein kinase domain-containing protein [Cinnamomum micranthum f. kanehirae]